jgi:pyruvate formate lyase activating enzyme
MRCDYCYNKDIVFAKSSSYSFGDILEFLKTRVNLLDGVVLSGGEATTHNLTKFCIEIKKLGFKIKLDTNGGNFLNIKELCDLKLLDFIALDYKAPKDKFTHITHSNSYDEFSKVLDFLIKSDIDFEVRTTLHNDLLNEENINEIIYDLKNRGYENKYYLQMFLDSGVNIANIKAPKNSFDRLKISNILEVIYR